MRNIYDATDKQKEELIEISNEDIAYYKRWQRAEIKDLVMIRTTNQFPMYGVVEPTDEAVDTGDKASHWTLNGVNLQHKDFIIVEPFEEQVNNPGLSNINEADTWFKYDIKLSKRATILMSEEKYNKLCKSYEFKRSARNLNIALFRGDKELALKMLLLDKRYVWFGLEEDGFVLDEMSETKGFGEKLKLLQQEIVSQLQQLKRNVTYGKTQQYQEETIKQDELWVEERVENQTQEIKIEPHNPENHRTRMITGLTPQVEGDIELDDTCYATTAIGKRRENQEDAVILLKDIENPNFKMMVVADGMGGEQHGEIASNILIERLKEWFEGLNKEEKESYYSGVTSLQGSLNNKINEASNEIVSQLYGLGGATLVCAIIGEHDTLITNVGDSRAYVIKDGRLEQVTIDDAIVQEEFEKGNIPYREAMRFHREAAGITECVGMGKIKDIHSITLNNDDYNMLLLFSDGVTDCLSEEDIAVICKSTNRKEVAKRLVQKSIEHDSIAPDELIEEYVDFNFYIPGGKDNSTTAVYLPKKGNDEEEER